MIPAASILCLGCSSGILLAGRGQSEDEKHKFLKQMEQKKTYKEWLRQRHLKYIGILKHLENQMSKENLHEKLKKASYTENVKLGQRLSSRIPDIKTFADPFRNENSSVGRTIVREIIEDTDQAFEMKITECLTEIVFREANALDLGYACVCHADFGLPEGMDLNFKLVRTKTLMQGHDCCNHRYVLEE